MEVKRGYKQTDVGVIPEDWEAVSLESVTSDIGDGIHATPIYSSTGDYYFINGNNLHDGKIVFTEATKTVDHMEFMKHHVNLNDKSILMSINGTIGSLGLFAGEPIVLGKSAAFLNVKDKVSKIFIYQLVQTEMVKCQFFDGLTGTTIKNLGLATIRGTKIPLPPTKSEQEAIANALSDADALIESLEQLIAKRRQIKQGAMQELLTGKRRLPGFEGKWELKNLFSIADNKKDLFNDGDWVEAEFLTESGIRLVQTGNIGEGQFIDKEAKKYISPESFVILKCKELRVGDILICRLADPAGRACILPDIGEERMITAVDVTIFRPLPTIADRCYLVNIFNTPKWFEAINERCGGSTRSRISRGQLAKMEVKLPPLAEQIAIANILTDMDAAITALESKLAKARQIKQGMMQELLTGRIRLI